MQRGAQHLSNTLKLNLCRQQYDSSSTPGIRKRVFPIERMTCSSCQCHGVCCGETSVGSSTEKILSLFVSEEVPEVKLKADTCNKSEGFLKPPGDLVSCHLRTSLLRYLALTNQQNS